VDFTTDDAEEEEGEGSMPGEASREAGAPGPSQGTESRLVATMLAFFRQTGSGNLGTLPACPATLKTKWKSAGEKALELFKAARPLCPCHMGVPPGVQGLFRQRLTQIIMFPHHVIILPHHIIISPHRTIISPHHLIILPHHKISLPRPNNHLTTPHNYLTTPIAPWHSI
jgi:hypothetical protein